MDPVVLKRQLILKRSGRIHFTFLVSRIHLGWEQLVQLIDPFAAVAAQQRSASFNQRYGAAIRALREEHAVRQTQIPGLTERHLRRVEHGELAATRTTLERLAAGHQLPIDEYLKQLARRLSMQPGQ